MKATVKPIKANVKLIDTSNLKVGQDLYIHPDKAGCLITMEEWNNIQRQKLCDITNQTCGIVEVRIGGEVLLKDDYKILESGTLVINTQRVLIIH